MIQRIQSIFLLLAVVSIGLLFVDSFNFAIASEATASNSILSDGDYDTSDYPLLMGLAGVSMAILLISILLFKNRSLQSITTKLGVASIVLLTGAAAYYFGTNETLAESMNTTISPSFGWANPIFALVFTVLALRGISKDDKLVKSMDRLR